ncbi:hypothetical protein SAMN04487996_110237 [Dyadobacter soli]|uniref:Uncharacterized protein n=1 Tax=Dyadobacter soli TaxID=659014 RepID=A0A1G7KW99_9BACT|nr:hypothetical protein [Dyadobacter soli]SDF41366.1 hypothetical protein SAMN04487996_110237 [Dyadobacter soli]
MQHTFHLKAGSMTPAFADLVRKMFGDGELTVVVEHVNADNISQQDQHRSLTALRERFKDAKVDPNIDISKLADEVNL